MIPGTTITTTLIRQATSKASPAAAALAQTLARKSFSTEKAAPALNQTEIDRRNKEAERYYPNADDGRSPITEIAAGYWTARGNPETSAKVAKTIANLSDAQIKADPVAKALRAETARLNLKPEPSGTFTKAVIQPYGGHFRKLLREEALTGSVANKAPGDVIQAITDRVLLEPQQNQGRGRG